MNMRSTVPWMPHWPGWSHLPRDARDALFLLAVIAWTIAPHFVHLPTWCLVLTAVVVGVGFVGFGLLAQSAGIP